MHDAVVKKFTFAVSSGGELLVRSGKHGTEHDVRLLEYARTAHRSVLDKIRHSGRVLITEPSTNSTMDESTSASAALVNLHQTLAAYSYTLETTTAW